MFHNSRNAKIAGGSFSITNSTNFNVFDGLSTGPLGVLHKRAAPNAILNAGGRGDEVRCHPGTRKEVLGRVEMWRDSQDSQTPPIFWLSGPAGAGKTAIVQTIAERCKEQRLPQANFFFFRTDPSRNNLSPLVATVVHQILLLYPSLRHLVADILSNDPLILDSTLDDQLAQLIVTPLQVIRQSTSTSTYHPPLLLIDGLDECGSEEKRGQRQILQAFDKILAKHPCLFRLLVASRDESQIQAAFNNISSRLLPLYLDGQYKPENDIRAFVIDEFKRVRRTHPLAHMLDASWPSVKDIEDIVRKSSGQFIYASTVLRFIMDSPASPELSLTRVQGAAQISGNSKSPFSNLDAMYTFILSRVDDQETLKDILRAQLLISKYQSANVKECLIMLLKVYNPLYIDSVIYSCLANLTPLARYTKNSSLLFHHASFPDYLEDQSRSSSYFVDVDEFNLKSQPAIWRHLTTLTKHSDPWINMCELAVNGLRRLHQLPPGFMNTLMALGPSCLSSTSSFGPTKGLLNKLYNLCSCDDDVTNYKQILRQWIYFKPFFPSESIHPHDKPDGSDLPPYCHRYLAMANIECAITLEPLGWIDIALRPRTESDVQETTLWLNSLLYRIHREKNHNSIQLYNRLVQKWVSWATLNNIPLEGVGDIPSAWWYLRRSRLEKWVASLVGLSGRL